MDTGNETSRTNYSNGSRLGEIEGIRPLNNNNEDFVSEVETMEDGELEMPIAAEPEGLNEIREIKIKPLSSGFLVQVGCQQIAIESISTLVNTFTLYLNNPNEFETKWFSKKTTNRLENIAVDENSGSRG